MEETIRSGQTEYQTADGKTITEEEFNNLTNPASAPSAASKKNKKEVPADDIDTDTTRG